MATLDMLVRQAEPYELAEGETAHGEVLRLPRPGGFAGNSLVLGTRNGSDRGIRVLPASAKKGHTVLANELGDQGVKVGEWVEITYLGRRTTRDGQRSYRDYDVKVVRA
jgi:hypothetical protein